jgi:hypothetical protein
MTDLTGNTPKKMETLSSNVVKNSAQAQYTEDIKIMKPGKMISQKYSLVQVLIW